MAGNLIETLNMLRSKELAAIVQYMRHHYVVTGADGAALAGTFKEISIVEMKHAEELGERIDFLGGDPTTKPGEIRGGGESVQDAARLDMAAEEEAVGLYKDAIREAEAAGDIVTRRLLESILMDEEEHLNEFRTMLGQ
jgi:bacterioferritin